MNHCDSMKLKKLPKPLRACAPAALLILALTAEAAAAGQCRAAVRPLLLTQTPDPAQVQKVRDLCQAEAVAGDPQASYQLALFHLGLGNFEPVEAIPLIRDAAGRGVSEAQYWLAWQYEAGPLLDHDQATALSWYQRAAESNHRLAIARLAAAYEHGELGLPADRRKAAEFHARQSRCMKKAAASS